MFSFLEMFIGLCPELDTSKNKIGPAHKKPSAQSAELNDVAARAGERNGAMSDLGYCRKNLGSDKLGNSI